MKQQLNEQQKKFIDALLGDANGINEEHKIYDVINGNHIQEMAIQLLQPTNCSLLKVKAS
jgi:hypothetical protein